MASLNKTTAAVALLVFALALLYTINGTDALRMCRQRSINFHGRCVSTLNCASVCYRENDGVGTGHCRRIELRTCEAANDDDDDNDGFDINARIKKKKKKCRWNWAPVCLCTKPCDAVVNPPPPEEETPPAAINGTAQVLPAYRF